MTTLVVSGIVAIVVLWAIMVYNNLVNLRNRVRNAFSQIDVQLTRRHDLIPNLIESVKAYMQHERSTLEAVIDARNLAVAGLKRAAADPANGTAIRELAGAEASLVSSLGRLFALAEAYPELKANQNMLQFQEELASTENKVAFARQSFNDSVMLFNNGCQNFPGSVIAHRFGFTEADFLKVDEPANRETPKVSFR